MKETNMSPDKNPGQGQEEGFLTDEQVTQLDEILAKDPSQVATLINAAQSGDLVAVNYIMRSGFGMFGSEGFHVDGQGNVSADVNFVSPKLD
jgi:hypothetical protein